MSDQPSHTQSINPFTGETIRRYAYMTDEQIAQKLDQSETAYQSWRKVALAEKENRMMKVAELLTTYKNQYAKTISDEMGKPMMQAVAEVEKCAWVCRFYAKNAHTLLQPEIFHTEAHRSYVRYDSIGPVLAVMPWNYPFWQLFRFAAPNVLIGNTVVLKHASNVTGCAKEIENIFLRAGYPEGVFQTIVARSDQIGKVIENPVIRAVSLTGSKQAGQAVAQQCGAQVKKSVLELGGSNACVIFDDANLDAHIDTLIWSRFQNTGQSCIAGKRFIVCPGIYDTFLEKFQRGLANLTVGNPAEEDTDIGPMATETLAKELEEQMNQSVKKGAHILMGGQVDGTRFAPTILTEVTPDMEVFAEETFGPLAAVIRADNDDHAIELSNRSQYGLGVSLFTEDMEKVERYIPEIEDGAVFVNELVKSDPRLPFGGTKNSGYGRELSRAGMREFTNQKTIYIR